MSNGWTGGQYSAYRVIFGAYLFIHFSMLLPRGSELFSNQGMLPEASLSPFVYAFPNILAWLDAAPFVAALLLAASGASLLFALGAKDRWAALLLWYIWACLHGRNPLIANPSLPFVGCLLLLHVCLPTRPYGSWARRGDPDPGAGWRMPAPLFAAAWILMSLGYAYSGYTKLISPGWLDQLVLVLPDPALRLAIWSALALQLGFAPLALFRRLRPVLWMALLGMHLGLALLIDFADLSLGLVILHLVTFNPDWVRPARGGSSDILFYDGSCALCHGAVRFVLAEDRSERAFRFAPLESELFRTHVPESERAALPDSMVLCTADARLLTRSDAVLEVLARLGGLWRIAGALGRVIPRPLRDALYNGIAAVRYRVFGTKVHACPILPPELRERVTT